MRTRWVVCPECMGAGAFGGVHVDWYTECDVCLGTGLVREAHPDGDFVMHRKEDDGQAEEG